MYVTDVGKQGISDLLEIVKFTITSPLFNSKNTFLNEYLDTEDCVITADGDMIGQLNISVSDLLSMVGCGYPICLAIVVALSDYFYMEVGKHSWEYNKGLLVKTSEGIITSREVIYIVYHYDTSIFHP